MENRIDDMLNMAVADYLKADSFIRKFEERFIDEKIKEKGNELTSAYFLLFIMSLIEYIIEDAGTGNGGKDIDDNETKIVAKIFDDYYEKIFNYFSFYVPDDMVKEELENFRLTRDYILDKTIDDFDIAFILERIVPAFYYSLFFTNKSNNEIYELSDYVLEIG